MSEEWQRENYERVTSGSGGDAINAMAYELSQRRKKLEQENKELGEISANIVRWLRDNFTNPCQGDCVEIHRIAQFIDDEWQVMRVAKEPEPPVIIDGVQVHVPGITQI